MGATAVLALGAVAISIATLAVTIALDLRNRLRRSPPTLAPARVVNERERLRRRLVYGPQRGGSLSERL